MSKFSVGQMIHIDAENEEWGRVATDAEIVVVYYKTLLVRAISIRANILIKKREAAPYVTMKIPTLVPKNAD